MAEETTEQAEEVKPPPTEVELYHDRCQEAINSINSSSVIQSEIVCNEVCFYIDKSKVVSVISGLRSHPDLRFEMLSSLTAIDYLNLDREPRFDVVYHLYSLEIQDWIRLKAPVDEDDCAIDSICKLWSGANFMEREVFDMFGITFNGHPNMTRILMPEDWEGHPLRKDFPIGGSKSFYYKHETNEYAGEPADLIPRIRVQDSDI